MMLRLGRVRGFLMLVIVAAIPRLLGAFFLPNTFGDAYVYIRDIGTLSTKIKAGTFALTDLYGFWLPLYQLVSALVNVFVGNGFYTGKIVSALAGVGVCLLVYAITLRVVQNQTAALLSFLLIALNPLHIMNSASAMTDVPHALLGARKSLFCAEEALDVGGSVCCACRADARRELDVDCADPRHSVLERTSCFDSCDPHYAVRAAVLVLRFVESHRRLAGLLQSS